MKKREPMGIGVYDEQGHPMMALTFTEIYNSEEAGSLTNGLNCFRVKYITTCHIELHGRYSGTACTGMSACSWLECLNGDEDESKGRRIALKRALEYLERNTELSKQQKKRIWEQYLKADPPTPRSRYNQESRMETLKERKHRLVEMIHEAIDEVSQ